MAIHIRFYYTIRVQNLAPPNAWTQQRERALGPSGMGSNPPTHHAAPVRATSLPLGSSNLAGGQLFHTRSSSQGPASALRFNYYWNPEHNIFQQRGRDKLPMAGQSTVESLKERNVLESGVQQGSSSSWPPTETFAVSAPVPARFA